MNDVLGLHTFADQNAKDHAALERAVRKGTVKAVFEEDR